MCQSVDAKQERIWLEHVELGEEADS